MRIWQTLLREARQRAGKRQEDIARDIGVSQVSVSRWEKGEFTPKERLREYVRAVTAGQPGTDAASALANDMGRPLAELKAEAVAWHDLIEAVQQEKNAGGDRVLLNQLAAGAVERLKQIGAALDARLQMVKPQ